MAFINSSNKSALEMLIRNGVACDGTAGDDLLKRLGVKGIWPLDAFGVKNLTGDGCRFKVAGTRFSGDVAIKTLSGQMGYAVLFGVVKNKQFESVRSFAAVPAEKLTALLSAVADDVNAEVV